MARFFRSQREKDAEAKATNGHHSNGNGHNSWNSQDLSKAAIRSRTMPRRTWSIISSVFLFISLIFVIMVEIGNTYNKPVLTKIWFINLNLTNVIPESVPNSALINSIAQTLGLHDFYTVGLWGYCEGYNSQGVTDCSAPRTVYWFNPVEIIQSELLAGASIQLPEEVSEILNIIHTASKVMFIFFLAGACLTTVMIFIKPFMVPSRWAALLIGFFSFINAALITIATVIATVMFIIMRNVFQTNDDVNIKAEVGVTMFALMWVAAAFSIFAFVIDVCLMCCCASTRDIKKGKKHGHVSKKSTEA